MSKTIYISFLLSIAPFSAFCTAFTPSPFDLTIVGQVKYGCSLARLPIGLTNSLKNDLKINLIPTPGMYEFCDVPLDVQSILKNPDKTPGNVALLFDVLWLESVTPADFVPEDSFIKIAYSMLEGTAIPTKWVELLNEKFDMVVVPDEFYKSVYLNCGVKIPIFVLPHGIHIEEYLNTPTREAPSKPFIFSSSAAFWPRKNHELLIEAFHKEFGNNPDVQLRLQGRMGFYFYFNSIQQQIKSYQASNIHYYHTPFTKEQYNDFLRSTDCYVLLSKGEGFSITPREALALEIPCIISNNTAHKTICQTGYVYSVPSLIEEPALYIGIGGYWGVCYNSLVSDVQKALRDVYTNYATYKSKAKQGRLWVQKYLWKNLKPYFHNLIKPKKVLLGGENMVTKEFLMTTSKELMDKYLRVIEPN